VAFYLAQKFCTLLEEIKRNITAVNQKSKKVSKIQAIIKTIKK